MANNVIKLILDDTPLEEKVAIIEEVTAQRLKNYIQESDVPSELAYIVDEITIRRFNRLGSEGMSSMSQESLSMTFLDDDFSAYKDELDEWLEENKPANNKGWVFINA